MQLMGRILRQLGACSNMGTPINLLPSEILLNVFAILQQDNNDIFSSFPPRIDRRYRTAYSLISVTDVCQRWRTLALMDRSLWKCWKVPQCTVGHLTLAQEIYRRSDPLPFQLQLLNASLATDDNGIIEAGTELSRLLGKTPQRIQALYVEDLQSITFLDPLAQSLHNLTMLHLNTVGWDDDDDARMTFLDSLDAPIMKRLSFNSFTGLPSRLPTSLIHLSLCEELMPCGFEEFLDLLMTLPRLQELRLHEAGPFIMDPVPYPSRSIPLNYLHSFSQLSDSASEYPLHLLHNLHMPSLTTIRWDLRFTNARVKDLPIADDMIPWKLPPPDLLQNLTRMVIRLGTKHLYEVCDETMYLDDVDMEDLDQYLPPSWLPRFLPNVQSLIITWINVMDRCGALLQRFSALSSLECRLQSIDALFFLALEREKDPMLPQLKKLTLWHDPLVDDTNHSGGIEDALRSVCTFSEEFRNALSTSRVAVRERGRGGASTFTVRLELGNIDHWEWRDVFLESLIPEGQEDRRT